MSLLMDALKKAEQAKRQSDPAIDSAAAPSGGAQMSLEPTGSDLAPNAGRPPQPLESDNTPTIELEPEPAPRASGTRREPNLGDEVSPAAGQASTRQPVASRPARTESARAQDSSQSRKEVNNLFAAKETAQPPAVRKNFVIVAGLLTVVAASVIGGYVWWQIQPKSGLATGLGIIANNSARPIAPAPPPPATPPAAASPAPQSAPVQTGETAGKTSNEALTGPATVVAKPASAEDADEDVVAPRKRRLPAQAASVQTESGDGIRVTRAPQKAAPSLMRAYDAFNRGETALARTEYEAALKADPHNTDALHGMAAISQREGRADAAAYYFQRILVANPKDAAAAAGLINMQGRADPSAAESRLKSFAAEQPDDPAPHFALGNLYAARERWGEAQQAYFRAYNLDPANPDTLFNLAVSLEHLRQDKLAAQYYGQSIDAAKRRPYGFDLGLAQTRLRALQP